jgi:hypothetical protein
MSLQMDRPSFFTRLMVDANRTWKGWLCCPWHGYQHDPLEHGYHNGWMYLTCQVRGCSHWEALARR